MATPFAAWAFHRAWWDAYSDNAHEQTLVAVAPGAEAGADPVAIVPLMHRHEVEPGDAELHTTLRHEGGEALTPVPPTAKAIFFGASYHADYATILADPADLPAVADALVDHLAEANRPGSPDRPWDVVDLRRLRCNDPAGEALAAAFRRRAAAESWSVDLEREDVCPVATLPAGGSIDDYLATLGKKERHEIRRKVRRAEAAGEVVLAESREPLADLDAFIDLHQRRWGADGLFPPTPGGDQSRVLFRRLFELFGTGRAAPARRSSRSAAGGSPPASISRPPTRSSTTTPAWIPTLATSRRASCSWTRLARRAIERGRRRLDFLRGNEPYKYEWGAVDEPIQRLLVATTVRPMSVPLPSTIPASRPVAGWPLPAGRDRIRVVELLATGTNGGAQEHVLNLVTRIDRDRYDVSICSLSPGAPSARLERAGSTSASSMRRTTPPRSRRVAAHLAAIRADVIHNHMYRAEIVGTQAAWRWPEAGLPRPYIVSTVHSSAGSARRGPRAHPAAHAADGPPDRGLHGDRRRRSSDEERVRRAGHPDLQRRGPGALRQQEPCCTLREEYGLPEDGPIVGVVARLEPEKGHPTLLDAWPGVLAPSSRARRS